MPILQYFNNQRHLSMTDKGLGTLSQKAYQVALAS